MSKGMAKQLYEDARRGTISKDALLRACLSKLESISEDALYNMALSEGFIWNELNEKDDLFDQELKELDATQRIIEKVLSRHGE